MSASPKHKSHPAKQTRTKTNSAHSRASDQDGQKTSNPSEEVYHTALSYPHQASLPRHRPSPQKNATKGMHHSHSVDAGSNGMISAPEPNGVIQHMRRRVSNSMEHYGNMLQDMAFPVLFRRNRNRSSSGNRQGRSGSKDGRRRGNQSKERGSENGEDFVFVENIELHHMNGFVFSSERELGRGHKFSVIQLNAPTWCDKCGDFIWGVYKQCLECQNPAEVSSSSSTSSTSSDHNELRPDELPQNERPKSFLRDEMDEFNKIFTELFSRSDRLTPSLEEKDEDVESECIMGSDDSVGSCNGSDPSHRTNQTSQVSQTFIDDTIVGHSIMDRRSNLRRSLPARARESRDSAVSDTPRAVRVGQIPEDNNDKLFGQLLDDLDNITCSNSNSVRRRRRARDLFSDWLFSEDVRCPQVPMRKKTNSAFRDFAAKRRSADVTNFDARRQEMLRKWRPHSCDCHSEDDTDSGYHTGHNTLRSSSNKMSEQPPGPSQATLTREDLRRSIESFNHNQYGLIMTLHSVDSSFQGFIRVHMNLIRPINMSISTRPPSIYDVMPHSADEEEEDSEEQITSFYLPKDTSKVIHIECETTTQEVIKALLTKYKITDNPRKFALYEKTTQNKRERLRRMSDDERPLRLCLSWTKDGLEGLDSHRFILQENDTGEILWEAFSIPELENFLGILNKEEQDYLEQVKNKYRLLRIQMDRRLKEIKPKPVSNSDSKRQPVFV